MKTLLRFFVPCLLILSLHAQTQPKYAVLKTDNKDTFLDNITGATAPVTLYESRTNTSSSCNGNFVSPCPKGIALSAYRSAPDYSTSQGLNASRPASTNKVSLYASYSHNPTSAQPASLYAAMNASGLPATALTNTRSLVSSSTASVAMASGAAARLLSRSSRAWMSARTSS